MPEVILPGASGRIEGRYSPGKRPNAPIALILHPHPKAGGHMNNPVAVTLHQDGWPALAATLKLYRDPDRLADSSVPLKQMLGAAA